MDYGADLSQYQKVSILGHCFDDKAVVHLAKHTPSNTMVAIKKFNMDSIKEDSYLVEREIILTRQLQHPNIIKYLISFVHGVDVCVVSPLMAYGSCRDLLNRFFNEGLPEGALISILKDVLDALDYIHKRGYIHRAVRASHILISDKGRACLSGFRYACPIISSGKWQKKIHSFPSNSCKKNLNWLSPELLSQNLQGYNEKSDIYSIGIVICELGNGIEPFSGMATTYMLTEKMRGCPLFLLDSTTIEPNQGDCEISPNMMNRKFSGDLHEVTTLCLYRDPYDRPTAAQLLTHPLFKYLHKRQVNMIEFLKPALPFGDRIALNSEEMADLDDLNKFSQMEIHSCEWDF